MQPNHRTIIKGDYNMIKNTFLKKTGFKVCPKCASTDIQDNANNMQCNACGYRIFFNVAAATSCILTKDNMILFVVRKNNPKKGLYDLPGGFADYDETLEEGMKRELLEEISYNPPSLTYFSSYPNTYEFASVQYHNMDCFFTGNFEETAYLKANDDAESIVWVKICDIDFDTIAFDSVKKALNQYISR